MKITRTLAHFACFLIRAFAPDTQARQAPRQFEQRKLEGIGLSERHMVTVKMADCDIGGLFHKRENTSGHSFADSHLDRMRLPTVAEIAECQARINKDPMDLELDLTAKAAYPHGFGADYPERRPIANLHFGIDVSKYRSHKRTPM